LIPRALFQPKYDKLVMTDVRLVELTKYPANAILATRISCMNELANVAESVRADIENVPKAIVSDSQIG
jgi:UDPglucose 6-dehydrogenase